VFGGFSMMLCGVFVMVGCFGVMFVNRMLVHNSSPRCVARTASPFRIDPSHEAIVTAPHRCTAGRLPASCECRLAVEENGAVRTPVRKSPTLVGGASGFMRSPRGEDFQVVSQSPCLVAVAWPTYGRFYPPKTAADPRYKFRDCQLPV
jgi:hypothetical protein